MQGEAGKSRFKIRMVEMAGTSLKRSLQKCDMSYHGETSRNAYSRCGEHKDELLRKCSKSVLWNHCPGKHGWAEPEFRYQAVKVFGNDAMLRQITEAVAVRRDGRAW